MSHLGDMLTSRIQGLRFSSNMMSKPNSSWQLYGDRTLIFSKLRTYGSDLEKTEITFKDYNQPLKIRKLAVLCSVNDSGNIRNDGLNHNVFDLLPDEGGVHSPGTKILPQGFQGPERSEWRYNFLIN